MLYHHMPRKLKELRRTEDGNLILDSENLKTLCLYEGLYQYPEMNSKLYLMYKSIRKIENLGEYVNLKALYLDHNVIKKIEGLACLPNLQSLFLQNNMIQKIENIDTPHLKILNISYNQLDFIENLSHLEELQSLTLSNNYFSGYQSIAHLALCSPTITNLDLSSNKIENDDPNMLDLFKNIKCLYLMGNPAVRDMKFYRRTVIANLPNLMYLDQRTVDSDERMIAELWKEKGEQGVQEARHKINDLRNQRKMENRQEIMKNIDFHRNAKINLFKSAIEQSKKEIKKLEDYMNQPNCQTKELYAARIQDELVKINDYYDMIIGIEKRMGRVVTEKELEFAERLQQMMHAANVPALENPEGPSQEQLMMVLNLRPDHQLNSSSSTMPNLTSNSQQQSEHSQHDPTSSEVIQRRDFLDELD